MFNNKRVLIIVLTAVMALMMMFAVTANAAAQDQPPSSAPYLGITAQPADNGVLVGAVAPNSPAASAELKTGDIITAINGKNVTADNIRSVLAGFKVGDSVKLSVTRGSQTLDLSATLAARPTELNQEETPEPSVPLVQRPLLGVALSDSDKGATISTVAPNSPADKSGLKPGDIISQVNGKTVKTAQDIVQAISALKPGDVVKLQIQRGTDTLNIEATLAAGGPATGRRLPFNFNGDAIIYNSNTQVWLVLALDQNGTLYKDGLRQGDRITQFDGKAYDPAGLSAYLKTAKGDVKVTVDRSGKSTDLTIPAVDLQNINVMGGNFGGRGFTMPMVGGPFLGVQFVMLDEQVAKDHNVKATVGALVTDIQKDSPADKAGLKANDVVTAVNGDTVNAEHTLRDRIAALKAGDKATLDVNRDGQTQKIDVTLGTAQMGQGMMPFDLGPNGNGFGFQMPMPQVPPAQATESAAPKA